MIDYKLLKIALKTMIIVEFNKVIKDTLDLIDKEFERFGVDIDERWW